MTCSEPIVKAIQAADAALEATLHSQKDKKDIVRYLTSPRPLQGLPSVKQRLTESGGGMKTMRIILQELENVKPAPPIAQKYIIDFGIHLAELDEGFKKVWEPAFKDDRRLKVISRRISKGNGPPPGRF